MAKALKVFRGRTYRTGVGPTMGLVCAPSKTAAVAMLGNARVPTSLYEFNQFWSRTAHPLSLRVATREGVWFGRVHMDKIASEEDFEHVYSPT